MQKWNYRAGWTGGTVGDVIEFQGALLASSFAGLYRSEDDGESWRRVEGSLFSRAISSLAFAGPSLALAASTDGRLFSSADGVEWDEIESWAGLGQITDLAPSPVFEKDSTLFAATLDGIFRSLDGGKSWESSTFGLLDSEILTILPAPDFGDSEVVWAGSAWGLYRSRNGGRAWRDAGRGLPDGAVPTLIALEEETGGYTLLAGTEADGLFALRPGEDEWHLLSDELSDQSVNSLAILEGEKKTLIAGLEEGLAISPNQGASWSIHKTGWSALAITPRSNGDLVSATWSEGIHVSSDGGETWRTVNGTGPNAIIAHEPPLALMLSGRSLLLTDLSGGAVYSRDGGESWQGLGGDPNMPIHALVNASPTVGFGADSEVLYRIEHVNRLEPVNGPDTTVTHIVPSPRFEQDETLLLATEEGLSLFQQGELAGEPLPLPSGYDGPAGMALSPGFAQNGRLYLAGATRTDAGYQIEIFQTLFEEREWENLAGFTSESPVVLMQALSHAEHHPLLIANRNQIITLIIGFETGELSVEQAVLPENVQLVCLLTSPDIATDQTLYAGSSRGVWRSTDGGTEWHPFGEGIEKETIVSLHGSPDGALTAVGLGGRLWELT